MNVFHSYRQRDVQPIFHQAGLLGGVISRDRFIKEGRNPRGDTIWSSQEIDFLRSLLSQDDFIIQDGPLKGRRDIATLQQMMEEEFPSLQRSKEAIRAQIRRLHIESVGGSSGACPAPPASYAEAANNLGEVP